MREILGKNKLQKLQTSKIHNLSSLSYNIYPEKKIGPFPASSAQHTDSTYVVPGPPAPTTYLAPHSRQAKLVLILTHKTRRRTTVASAEARNGSWRMARTQGVGLFRLFSASICMSSMHARTSVALTCPIATRRSLSTGILIPARQQQQHGGLRLPRSFRGFLLFQVGCRACLKRRAAARILG